MRVLLDTNVLVRAAGKSDSPARAIFLRLLKPPHTIVASKFLLDELRRVLNYPRVQRIHGRSVNETEQFVLDVEAISEIVDVLVLPSFHILHDPDDDPIAAAAVYGRVDFLCTLDRHLRRPEVIAYFAPFNIYLTSSFLPNCALKRPVRRNGTGEVGCRTSRVHSMA